MSNAPEMLTADSLEIDLLAWLRTVIRAWKLLVGIIILALLVAGVYTLLQPRLYKATAVLTITQTSLQTSPDPQLVVRMALEVALSDRMVSEVYDLVRPQNFQDRDALRRAMEAAVGRDPRLVRLTVWSPDASEAAAVANMWARLVVVRVNDVYLGRSPTPALALAQGNPGPGEAADPVLLQVQRDVAQADLKALQEAIYGLEGVERDIRAFRERVARADGGVVSLEDQLTALFLQLRAFGVSAPDRIEFGSEQLGGLTKDRQALLARLDDLIQAVATWRGEMEARIAARRAEVEELSRRMQAVEFGSGVGMFVAVGAPAMAPDRPAYPRPALNLGVGGALGLVVGLAFVTAREALRGPANKEQSLPDVVDFGESRMLGSGGSAERTVSKTLKLVMQRTVRQDDASCVVIRPSRGLLSLNLTELWQYRELLYILIWRDLKVRYKQTAIGAAWAVIQPFLAMVIFSVFFGHLARIPSEGIPYPIFAYSALLLWQFFAKSLTEASTSLVVNERLITKAYFPRLLVPSAAVLGGLVDFALALIVLAAMMAYYGIAVRPTILTIPFFLLVAVVTALGVSFWLSALDVMYRDVRYTLPFLTQIWFFATPVVYPSSLVPEEWRALYGLNPMVGVVEGFRWALLGISSPPSPSMLAVSTVSAAAILLAGTAYFRYIERTLADHI